MDAPIVLCLTGDVMTGRGVDQILPAPGNPRLWETGVQNARTYVALAEAANGPIPAPVPPTWPWGAALPLMAECDLRILNLETAITTSDRAMPDKAIHYRMNPANLEVLSAASPDACVLANNHVLDFSVPGLLQTLQVLTAAGLGTAGAGRDDEAWRPLELTAAGRRVLVWSVGAADSGIPASWAAGPDRTGVASIDDLADPPQVDLCARIERTKRPGDLAVVSVHWGSNWGYRIPRAHVRLAHRLVDAGADVVHGHSSHHPRPVEVYRDRLILYGCGDLVNDYEGISGFEEFRGDLRPLYLATIDGSGRLLELRIAPFRARRMRLEPTSRADAAWLARTLTSAGRRFASRVVAGAEGTLRLQW